MFKETLWIYFSLQKFEQQFFQQLNNQIVWNKQQNIVDVGLTIMFQVLYI